MRECKFCRDLEELKGLEHNPKLTDKYMVDICVETYCGKSFRGQSRYGLYEIKYCPACGNMVR